MICNICSRMLKADKMIYRDKDTIYVYGDKTYEELKRKGFFEADEDTRIKIWNEVVNKK